MIGRTAGSPYDSGTEAGPGGGGVATSVLGGVLQGGEESCLLPCRSPRHTIRQSVRAKFRDGEQLLSLSGTEAAQEAGVEQRLFGGGNNKPPAASMNNQSNFTIDPSCRDKPPLAVDIILSE